MRKWSLKLTALAALTAGMLGLTAFAFGGWAVITVDDLPGGLTVGRPVKIAFSVRQHGMMLLDHLSPTLVAVNEAGGGPDVSVTAVASGGTGHYVATLTVPRSGEWTITINSGFLATRTTLYPIPAVPAGAREHSPRPAFEVGQRLFVAKGCVTCHVHDGASRGNPSISVGPDLTQRRYQGEYLAKLLADPSIARTPGKTFIMPNLGLAPPEIAALVAFVNARR